MSLPGQIPGKQICFLNKGKMKRTERGFFFKVRISGVNLKKKIIPIRQCSFFLQTYMLEIIFHSDYYSSEFKLKPFF